MEGSMPGDLVSLSAMFTVCDDGNFDGIDIGGNHAIIFTTNNNSKNEQSNGTNDDNNEGEDCKNLIY